NGIVVGVVVNIDDPLNIARVMVRFPHLAEQESYWARLVTPMAGKKRGFHMRPEGGDEVLVAFEHGDIRFPYVLGGVWSQPDEPPPFDGGEAANNWRFMHSRSGHIFKFDDKPGAEKIEIIDKSGSHKIVIDAVNQKIQVICDSGDVEVTAKA